MTYNLALGLGMQQSDPSMWTSLVAQLGENLPAVQETQVRSLSRESPCFFFSPSPFKIIFKIEVWLTSVQFSSVARSCLALRPHGLQRNLQCCVSFRSRAEWARYVAFPGGSAGKESACSAGDVGLIPELQSACFFLLFCYFQKLEYNRFTMLC